MSLKLVCTGCGDAYAIDDVVIRCRQCGEPLDVQGYESPSLRPGTWHGQTLIERYAEFLPVSDKYRSLSLREGFTPLLECPQLSSVAGCARVLLKNETVNPTWSFKDRGTLVAMCDAISRGYDHVGVVSTGNMAASVAAYGARAGVRVLVLVSEGMPAEKYVPIGVHGATVVRVSGDYAAIYERTVSTGAERIRFLNSDVPMRVEGSKTIAYEICEQTGYEPPQWVVVPTSSGGNLRGIAKGFDEMKSAGLISRVPRIVCVQAAGCAPIVEAWDRGEETVAPVPHPRTVAHAIENPNPPSGNAVLRRLRERGGLCVAVEDALILEAQQLMASCGVFGQPAAAVALAGVMVLADKEHFAPTDSVVCIATGSGLKSPDVVGPRLPGCGACDMSELDLVIGHWLDGRFHEGVAS